MRSHAKASTGGSNLRQATGLGRFFRGAFAGPALSFGAKGSGAPSRPHLSFLGVLATLLCSLVFAAAATAAEPLVRLSNFGPDGTELSNFARVGSIDVDEGTGSVYVLDPPTGTLSKFAADGSPVDFTGTSPYISENRITGLTPFTGDTSGGVVGATQVAVNSESHLIYVTQEHSVRAFQADGEPAYFNAGLGEGTNEIPGFTKLYGLALDSSGNIYASDDAGTVSVFSAAGAAIASFPVSGPRNLAVAPNGIVYVNRHNDAVQKFAPSAFPPSDSTSYTPGASIARKSLGNFIASLDVDPESKDLFLLEIDIGTAWIRRYEQDGALVESIGEVGLPGELEALGGRSEGIAVLGSPVEVREGEFAKLYAADTSENNLSQAAIIGTLSKPGPAEIDGLRATDVSSDAAVIRASINPHLRPTSYRIEYGLADCSLSVCAAIPVGGASLGEGNEPIAVSQTLLGLLPATQYHYRAVAVNNLDEETVASGKFTTQPLGVGFELSDDRAWEMVSPPLKGGATLKGPAYGLVQAASDGEGIAYLTQGSLEADPEGNRNLETSSVLARRQPGGWVSKDITPASIRTVPYILGTQSEYKLFSPDLSRSLLEPRDGTGLSPAASERTPYLRASASPPELTPLVTGREGFANVPLGTKFGGPSDSAIGGVSIRGSNPSLSSVVLQSPVSLLEGEPDAPPGLYHWEDGLLQPLSVLPDAEGGGFKEANWIGSGPGSVRHAVSDDGTLVFWAPGTYGPSGNLLSALYLFDAETGKSTRLDLPQPGATEAGVSHPAFQGASPDGTVAFFTDSRGLTADASPAGWSLYRCQIPAGDPSGGCAALSNISAPIAGSGEDSDVLGIVSGMAEDGSTVYFVARGELDSAPNDQGDAAVPGEPNLYRWQEGDGVRFIATLSEQDAPAWGSTPGRTLEANSAASPSGRFLGFMSQEDLTGQGNLDASSGKPVQEVFRYDASSDQLACVSCDPTGEAPSGEFLNKDQKPVDSREIWGKARVSAILPQPTILETAGESLYQPRAVLDSGRMFFNVVDSLVSADSNNQWDVYEFEPLGVGSCKATSGDAATARSGPGCVSLLTSGTAEEESAFLDASSSGDDVFFLTPSRLSVTDKDQELDLYDARVNGVPATLTPSAECLGEACQPAAVVPNDPTPASAGFKGQGNQKPKARKRCPKGKRGVRRGGKARCVARKQRGKAKRASQSRRVER